jgi:NADP-dependent 3-hydroxy acid dehydrogenase YdfG
MRERKTGTIINISSLSDRTSRPELAVYAATKAAIRSLTESLRMANAKHNIRFCNIAPAKVHTPMWKNDEYDAAHFISPQQFAEMVLWVYRQPQSICIRDLLVAPTDYEP